MGKSEAQDGIQTFLRIRPSKKPSGYFRSNELEPKTLSISLPPDFRSGNPFFAHKLLAATCFTSFRTSRHITQALT
jgi:hypothetical protein